MSRYVSVAATVLAVSALVVLLASTIIGMTLPARIIYRESSTRRTEASSVEVKEHGHSYFISPDQKRTLDAVRYGTPLAWWGAAAVFVLSMGVGSAVEIFGEDSGIHDD